MYIVLHEDRNAALRRVAVLDLLSVLACPFTSSEN